MLYDEREHASTIKLIDDKYLSSHGNVNTLITCWFHHTSLSLHLAASSQLLYFNEFLVETLKEFFKWDGDKIFSSSLIKINYF